MAARLMVWALAALLAMPLAAASLPDPTALPKFRASADAEGAHEAAALAWVRVNGRHSIAWYNGTTVKVGDSVEGGRVVAIHEDHIVLSGKGGRRAVYLLDHAIRTQPQAQPRPAGKNRN
ncbi:hypothetical protein [Thiobacillus denitrificans]|uniref:MSHA biogenesis protein MshK n=1 Tax=Thiobacillus denitrificans TaxID=36861 RepID=A0A106BJ01_THIDE|nr:hypothetical protein [Thiobacillus denitrificans]KVW93355.1 hypothetical protein ABW22_14605 [Thiobacillus denitrificans]